VNHIPIKYLAVVRISVALEVLREIPLIMEDTALDGLIEEADALLERAKKMCEGIAT